MLLVINCVTMLSQLDTGQLVRKTELKPKFRMYVFNHFSVMMTD